MSLNRKKIPNVSLSIRDDRYRYRFASRPCYSLSRFLHQVLRIAHDATPFARDVIRIGVGERNAALPVVRAAGTQLGLLIDLPIFALEPRLSRLENPSRMDCDRSSISLCLCSARRSRVFLLDKTVVLVHRC